MLTERHGNQSTVSATRAKDRSRKTGEEATVGIQARDNDGMARVIALETMRNGQILYYVFKFIVSIMFSF